MVDTYMLGGDRLVKRADYDQMAELKDKRINALLEIINECETVLEQYPDDDLAVSVMGDIYLARLS